MRESPEVPHGKPTSQRLPQRPIIDDEPSALQRGDEPDYNFFMNEATVTLDVTSTTFKGGVSSALTPLNNFSGSANTSIAALNTFTGSSFGGIFTTTGSFKSTTNNLDITGSVRVSNVIKFKELSSTPTYEEGGMFYSASNFYFGIGS